MGKGKKKGGGKSGVSDQPSAEEKPSTSSAPQEEEEEEGLGLGRKKRPKKKPAQEVAASLATTSQQSQPGTRVQELTPEEPPQSFTPPLPAPTPAASLPPAEESESLGLGLSGPKRVRPRKKKNVEKVPTPSQNQPTTSETLPTAAPSLPTAAPSLPTAAPSLPTAVPSRPIPTEVIPGFSDLGLTAPPQTQPTSGWGGAGRGRGRGLLQQSSLPADVSAPASSPRNVTDQQIAGPSHMQQPIQKPAHQQQPAQVSKPLKPSKSELVCKYSIPAKVINRNPTVPARNIKVLANYLPMEISSLKIHRYDVSFKPEKPKKMIPKAYQIIKAKYYPNEYIAFDQMKNCYSFNKLKNVPQDDRFTASVTLNDMNNKPVTFEVSFKFTGVVDLEKIKNYMKNEGSSLNPPSEEIQCVDVILRQGTLEAYIKSGRQFFKRPLNPINLTGGLEMWTGLFQSAIFTKRAFINIDVAHKGFPINQPMIMALEKEFRLDVTRDITKQRGTDVFLQYIKGLRVVAQIVGDCKSSGQKREFICNGLEAPPNCLKFTTRDSQGRTKTMTVAEYFAREKKYRLRYPDLNCMWVGPKDKKIYYPMELLEVSYGQVIHKQMNDIQLSTMVREAATPPDVRKRKIEEVIRDMNYSRNVFFKKFGLEISDQFLTVDAKVLMPPSLETGESLIVPRKGAWQSNRLLKPEALRSWGFVAIDSDPHRSNYETIKSLLMNTGRQMGMIVEEPRFHHFNIRVQNLREVLFSAVDKDVKFLVIIVSQRERDTYHRIKQIAEREVGILTQCIKENTASRRMNPQTARNILLKVNSKLMGINQALSNRCLPACLKGGGVMIVGADVTHPSPEQTSVPSIAAVTASLDSKFYLYNIELCVQTPKKEMIVQFEDMMVDHMKLFTKHQGSLPKKIFVFRDGVSEGQFAEVMNSELSSVHRAYRRLTGTDVKPEVLFMLVQKRHHTRLFVTGPNSSQNVEPGTVVDENIVHARELDFYLVSHQAIKGTARPTRYHAVCNDGAIPADEVEQLTYYLCHLYSRCMRAVSYPTPTYYAHLACLRARSLTHGETFDNVELEKNPKRLRVLDKMLRFSRMFFV